MRTLAFLTMAVLLAGCSLGGDGDDDGAQVKPGELQKVVLQPEDVPRVFIRFDEGRQGISDSPGGRREDANRFGRRGGWKARYRRSGTTETVGPLVIVSLIDAFESAGGAEDEYEALAADLREAELDWRPVEAPDLGDESLAMTFTQGTGPTKVDFFQLAWREGNAVASLEVNGFAGNVELGDASSLAEKMARRISGAAAS